MYANFPRKTIFTQWRVSLLTINFKCYSIELLNFKKNIQHEKELKKKIKHAVGAIKLRRLQQSDQQTVVMLTLTGIYIYFFYFTVYNRTGMRTRWRETDIDEQPAFVYRNCIFVALCNWNRSQATKINESASNEQQIYFW